MRNTFLATALVLICVPAVYGQGPVPAGVEFQVNTYTADWQGLSAISVLADGGFVVVWTSDGSNGSDSSEHSIQGQRFAAGGAAVGEEFQVNTYTTDNQEYPQVSALADGGFVVIWTSIGSSGSDSSGSSIQGQRYAADGIAVGEELQINTYTEGWQGSPAVAAFPDGGFLVVWHGRVSSGSPFRILGRLYAADGTAVGEEYQVSPDVPSNHWYPSVSRLDDGGFVVVWDSDAFGANVQGQRVGADGTVVGGLIQIGTSGIGRPSVSVLADGGFVVVWTSRHSSSTDSSGNSIQGRRFAADGTAVGGELQINTSTAFDQWYPSASALPNGGFVVVWYSQDRTGVSRPSTHGQLYGADGTAVGGEFQVGICTAYGDWSPSVSALANGFVMAWTGRGSCGSDSSVTSIQGQSFAAPRFALVGGAGKCLDIEAADVADGTPVNLFRCHGGDNQHWRIDLTSSAQRVRGIGDKCLVPGPELDSGYTRLAVGECGGTGELWRLLTAGVSKPSALLHVETGLCLDVEASASVDGTPAILFECQGGANQMWRPAPAACTRDSQGLCLNENRFRVDVDWRDYDGNTGSSRVVPVGSDDSGLFWFFSEDNWEMLIKVLDGCGINDRFWVFAAATTDVEYTLRVTDTTIGAIREYFNALGTDSAAITDSKAFDTCSASSTVSASWIDSKDPAISRNPFSGLDDAPWDDTKSDGICAASPVDLCLNDDRFLVEVEWRDYDGNTGSGRVVPVDSRDSGLLWFFSENNWEMLVKVLDGCGINDHYWVFAAATTDVEYRLRVTDLDTGEIREYFNPLGTAAPAITDSHAFEACF
ncbi:MAG: ricin-type beta-trefoil lectin domain protein [bacterium]|nr:ricin-type beta-trefoil lectin domain protein [bacterium]